MKIINTNNGGIVNGNINSEKINFTSNRQFIFPSLLIFNSFHQSKIKIFKIFIRSKL